MRWLALAAVVLVPAVARADEGARLQSDVTACVAASDEGQKLRDEGHLRAARAKLATCAAEECPSPVRANCVRWIDEVDKRTPSIVIAATSNGKDATDVSVSIDGTIVAPHLDGNAIVLDPGEHKVHYEHAGDPAQDEAIVLREGEKDRSLKVTFGKPPPSRVLPPPPPKPPTFAHAMTGVAIGSVLGWGGFGLAALLVANDWNQCQATCSRSDHQTIVLSSAIASDVSLGVAVVATGIAIWAYVKRARSPAPVTGVRLDVARGVLVF